ncbi:MAG: DUF4124 domain-containing protein [Deltaproteobacteria bacterium]|nr:DUF4124 domain-containing protein [Deltaproteobacteria bacterium]
MKQAFLYLTALSLACILLPSLCNAEIYKYVDKNGTVIMVDDVTKVPEAYRGQMEVSGGRRSKERPATALPTQADSQKLLKNLTAEPSAPVAGVEPLEGVQPPKDETRPAALMRRISAALDKPGLGVGLKIIIVVIAAIAAFLVIGRAAETVEAKKAGVLICILLIGAVSVFLFRVSAQKAADRIAAVMKNVRGIQGKLQGRTETARTIENEFKGEPGPAPPSLPGQTDTARMNDNDLLKEPDAAALNAAPGEEKITLTMPLPPRD